MPFGRLERTPPPAAISDINMTPLIDVMLVLLVIFLVTAPLMAASLKLELPAAGAGATAATTAPRALQVTMEASGAVRIDGEALAPDAWRERLARAARVDPSTEVHLRADRRVPYGDVAAFIDAAQQAGLARIGFATAPVPAGRDATPAR